MYVYVYSILHISQLSFLLCSIYVVPTVQQTGIMFIPILSGKESLSAGEIVAIVLSSAVLTVGIMMTLFGFIIKGKLSRTTLRASKCTSVQKDPTPE